MLRDRLEQEIKKSHRDGLQLAILFIDLDNFKTINDSLGHAAGDRMLKEVAVERQTGAFGMERLRQSEIRKVIRNKPRKRNATGN